MTTNLPPATCSIDGCSKTPKSRGWCTAHYNRWRRHGDPTAGNHTFGPQAFLSPDVLEDLEWMARGGESLTGAAARLTACGHPITGPELANKLRSAKQTTLRARLLLAEPMTDEDLEDSPAGNQARGKRAAAQERRLAKVGA